MSGWTGDRMSERVQKILSQWGIASRRKAEQMILEGRVHINGQCAELGQKVDLSHDQIWVDGQRLHRAHQPPLVYILLHKPIGVVCTCDDPAHRATVLDLLPPELRQGQGLHPVGRLDVDSTGALLLTNDGDLTFALTHPRHHIPKVYRVWVQGYPSAAAIAQWRQGLWLDGQKTLPAQVQIRRKHLQGKTLLEVVLREGRNRQIRRVADALGYPVLQLERTAIGPIQLHPKQGPDLAYGCYRMLTETEVGLLRTQIDLLSKQEHLAVGEECNV